MDEDTFTFALAPLEFTSLRIAIHQMVNILKDDAAIGTGNETLLREYTALYNKIAPKGILATDLTYTITLSRSELDMAYQAVQERATYWKLSAVNVVQNYATIRYSNLADKLSTILRGE